MKDQEWLSLQSSELAVGGAALQESISNLHLPENSARIFVRLHHQPIYGTLSLPYTFEFPSFMIN